MNKIGKTELLNRMLIIAASAATLLNVRVIIKELNAIRNEELVVFDPERLKEVDSSGK